MSSDVTNYPGLKPLQATKLLKGATLSDDGWTVEWPELDIQIGADTLYLACPGWSRLQEPPQLKRA